MKRLERVEDEEVAMRAALDGRQAIMWTALPGIIESFDPAAMTCVVQPAIKAVVSRADGTTYETALPLLLDCPVYFPGGGGFTLTFPVAKGDECLMVMASRCIDGWWQSGGVQSQAEFRMHDLSDGFAFVGFRSQPRAFGVSQANVQLKMGGETVMDIPPSGPIVFSRPIVAPNATLGGKNFLTHTHGGVQPGGGNTGAPV